MGGAGGVIMGGVVGHCVGRSGVTGGLGGCIVLGLVQGG